MLLGQGRQAQDEPRGCQFTPNAVKITRLATTASSRGRKEGGTERDRAQPAELPKAGPRGARSGGDPGLELRKQDCYL